MCPHVQRLCALTLWVFLSCGNSLSWAAPSSAETPIVLPRTGDTSLGTVQEQIDRLYADGDRCFQYGDLVLAREKFNAILKLQPNHALAKSYLAQTEERIQVLATDFYNKAEVNFISGDYQAAAGEYRKVLVLQPDHASAHDRLQIAEEWLATSNKDKSERERLAQMRPLFNKAWKAYCDRDFETALPLWEECLRLVPTHLEAKKYLALTRQKNVENAITDGRQALAQGDLALAEKHFSRALALDPNHPEASKAHEKILSQINDRKKIESQLLYKQGLEAFTAGRKQEAFDFWQKAIQIDPDNIDAQRGLQRRREERP